MASFEPELAPLGHAAAPDGSDAPALLIGRLYEQHFRMVRALCQLLLRDAVEAEDAAQQTFLSAFGSLIDGTVPELPAPWLATIARRECWARTAQRRRRPLALDETNAPASGANNPLDEAIRNVDLTALWRAINDLPRQQRSAFLMREFAGLSYAEVAEALGASESAIESLLVRARRQLRDGLAPAIRAANLVATPIVLLQHRLWRLFGGRTGATGAAATAGIPAAAKLGAALAGAVAIGSAGVAAGVSTGVLHGRTTPHPAVRALAAQPAGAGELTVWGDLDRLIGRSNAVALFPLASNWGSLVSPATDATAGPGAEGVAGTPGALTPVGPAPADGAPTPGEPTPIGPAPADGAPTPGDTTPDGSAGTDSTPGAPGAEPSASTDPSPAGDSAATDTAPTDTTPVDTTPGDTTPADTAPLLDTTPAVDPTPAEPAPGTDPVPTEPTDTTLP